MSKLHLAVAKGRLDRVEKLLREGEDVNGEFTLGKYMQAVRPLHVAAQVNNPKVAEFLLNSGAEINAVDKEGRTALHLAAKQGHMLAARFLLDKGAKINIRDKIAGNEPILYVARKGDKRMWDLFVEHGADIHSRNKEGATTLHVASKYGSYKIVEMLVDAGVDINAPDKDGRMPLDWAKRNFRKNVAGFLARNGAMQKAKSSGPIGCMVFMVGGVGVIVTIISIVAA